jgi:hypothetical protein
MRTTEKRQGCSSYVRRRIISDVTGGEALLIVGLTAALIHVNGPNNATAVGFAKVGFLKTTNLLEFPAMASCRLGLTLRFDPARP